MKGASSIPSAEHFHQNNDPEASHLMRKGDEKTEGVDEVEGPTQGHSLACDRVPWTYLMPQPVFFPPHDPTSSSGPHFIGDHSKTRSKSAGRLGIPQEVSSREWPLVTGKIDTLPPWVSTQGGNGDSTCRQLLWEVCKEWREGGFVGYKQVVWTREKLSMEMEKLNTEEET